MSQGIFRSRQMSLTWSMHDALESKRSVMRSTVLSLLLVLFAALGGLGHRAAETLPAPQESLWSNSVRLVDWQRASVHLHVHNASDHSQTDPREPLAVPLLLAVKGQFPDLAAEPYGALAPTAPERPPRG